MPDSQWVPFKNLILSTLQSVTLPDFEFYWQPDGDPLLYWTPFAPPIFGRNFQESYTGIPMPSSDLINYSFKEKSLSELSGLDGLESKLDKVLFGLQSDFDSISSQIENQSISFMNFSSSASKTERLKAIEKHKMVFHSDSADFWFPLGETFSYGPVLVKQEKLKKEWEDLLLEPSVHYLPVSGDLWTFQEVFPL